VTLRPTFWRWESRSEERKNGHLLVDNAGPLRRACAHPLKDEALQGVSIIKSTAPMEQARPEGSQKSYQTILEQEITEGLQELERPSAGLFISGLSAGLDVSFSLLLIAVTLRWCRIS
jgi:hypothetical protein